MKLIDFIVECFLMLIRSYFILLIWNNMLISVFKLPFINFGQAILILILCKILFSDYISGGYFATIEQENQVIEKETKKKE